MSQIIHTLLINTFFSDCYPHTIYQVLFSLQHQSFLKYNIYICCNTWPNHFRSMDLYFVYYQWYLSCCSLLFSKVLLCHYGGHLDISVLYGDYASGFHYFDLSLWLVSHLSTGVPLVHGLLSSHWNGTVDPIGMIIDSLKA